MLPSFQFVFRLSSLQSPFVSASVSVPLRLSSSLFCLFLPFIHYCTAPQVKVVSTSPRLLNDPLQPGGYWCGSHRVTVCVIYRIPYYLLFISESSTRVSLSVILYHILYVAYLISSVLRLPYSLLPLSPLCAPIPTALWHGASYPPITKRWSGEPVEHCSGAIVQRCGSGGAIERRGGVQQ